jgi:hypothetical protein
MAEDTVGEEHFLNNEFSCSLPVAVLTARTFPRMPADKVFLEWRAGRTDTCLKFLSRGGN